MEYLLSLLSGVVIAEIETAMERRDSHCYNVDTIDGIIHHASRILGGIMGMHKYGVCYRKCNNAQYDHDSGRKAKDL